MVLSEIIKNIDVQKDSEISILLDGEEHSVDSLDEIPIEFLYKEVTLIKIESSSGIVYVEIHLV